MVFWPVVNLRLTVRLFYEKTIMKTLFKLIPSLLITILIAIFWINDFMGFLIVVMFFWIVIPVFILALYFIIKALPLSNTSQKIIVGWGIFNLLFFISFFIYNAIVQSCSVDTMAKHYEKNGKEMDELVQYVDKALDDSATIVLEFEHGKASIFHVATKSETKLSQHWNKKAESKKDSLMNVVGLTHSEFEHIRAGLKKIGCIGISMSASQPEICVDLFFRRVGMGMYSYKLHYMPLTQDEKDLYMEEVEYIPYSEKVIFQYGGGAFGSQSFPNVEKEAFLSKHKPW